MIANLSSRSDDVMLFDWPGFLVESESRSRFLAQIMMLLNLELIMV